MANNSGHLHYALPYFQDARAIGGARSFFVQKRKFVNACDQLIHAYIVHAVFWLAERLHIQAGAVTLLKLCVWQTCASPCENLIKFKHLSLTLTFIKAKIRLFATI